MLNGPASLDDLRREIDRIDDALHDLLMQRTAVVEEVGRAKRAAGSNGRDGFFRPGREALILRRLAQRHTGVFPTRAVLRIWREIITGQLSVQTPIPVAVVASDGLRGCWDLARDHFGVGATLAPHNDAGQVVRAVRDGSAMIGVVPAPQEDDARPWWPLMTARDEDPPRIVARLPFAPRAGRGPAALAIARLDPEPTGDDCSYLVVESGGELSFSAVLGAFSAVGLAIRHVAVSNAAGAWMHLVEADGLVGAEDERLAALVARPSLGIARIQPIGGYAVPLPLTALDGAPEAETRP